MAYQDAFSALADPTRRGIFESLRARPQTVAEIAAGQTVSRPAVSQHLKVLQGADLVEVERRGTRRIYRIKPRGLHDLRAYLDDFWNDALAGFAAEVRRTKETSMPEPIVKTIEVPCNAHTAFSIFTDKITDWWPVESHSISAMNGTPAKSVTLEPKQGGRIIETGPNGERHDWGHVEAYEPGELLVLSWQVDVPESQATRVEVRFNQIDDGNTRVQLTHDGWEVYGEKGQEMRDGYNKGWVGVFEEGYAGACRSG